MRMRITTVAAALLGAGLMAIAGCGGGGGDDGGFPLCGNDVLDAGEQCDDGNQADEDACLGTCQLNVCGDGITNPAAEECDVLVLPPATCQTFGFASGTLACTGACLVDTSECVGTGGLTPTPTPTPDVEPGTPTETSTGDGQPTPTVTPTPGGGGGGACNAGDPVVVAVSIDSAYGAARIDLQYPAGQINIPGSGTNPSVVGRVTFAASGGLTTVNDDDNTGTITLSFVGFTEQPSGSFATVTFDCVTEIPPPSAFVCTVVSASTPGGVAIPGAGCGVSVQ